jgi:hypothetical protein
MGASASAGSPSASSAPSASCRLASREPERPACQPAAMAAMQGMGSGWEAGSGSECCGPGWGRSRAEAMSSKVLSRRSGWRSSWQPLGMRPAKDVGALHRRAAGGGGRV